MILLNPIADEQLSVTVPVALTVPNGAEAARLQPQGGAINYRFTDSTGAPANPTATHKFILTDGELLDLAREEIRDIRLSAGVATAVYITYFST